MEPAAAAAVAAVFAADATTAGEVGHCEEVLDAEGHFRPREEAGGAVAVVEGAAAAPWLLVLVSTSVLLDCGENNWREE